MSAVYQSVHTPIVNVIDGVQTILSSNIAEFFQKEHKNVLRDIEGILNSFPENRRSNFIEVQLERVNNFGAIVQTKA